MTPLRSMFRKRELNAQNAEKTRAPRIDPAAPLAEQRLLLSSVSDRQTVSGWTLAVFDKDGRHNPRRHLGRLRWLETLTLMASFATRHDHLRDAVLLRPCKQRPCSACRN